MVVMLRRGLPIAIAPQLLIVGYLIRVEWGAGLEMRGHMHQPQPTLQLGNGGRRGREAIRRDFAFGKKLIEGLFLRDQLAAERLGAPLMRSKIACTPCLWSSVSPSCAASASTCTGPG